MAAIKVTSKRQVTFPLAVCAELGLKAGDTLTLDPQVLEGERVWVLRRAQSRNTGWFGRFRSYARGKNHTMSAIRRSIARAREHGLT